MAAALPPTAPGQILAGKYRVERTLGEGGHGVVVAAEHMTLGERVAIKLLRPDVAEDQETVARFLREARASVRIKGEHVTRVLDVGSTANGLPYIVMEHLEGNDLSTIVAAKGWLPISVAVDYILQTCEALAEAHGLGIVHRDIKPSNLFLTSRTDGSPCIKVLDFGISKAMARVDGSISPDLNLTQTQTVLGSPQYMAPEQMRSSRVVDGRTDIWAVGTTLHELLTGKPPFEAQTMPELFAMILQDPTPRLGERRPEMPEALETIVARCLEKDPAKRFVDMHELARALAPFASSEGAAVAERIGRVGFNASRSSDRLLPLDAGSAPGVDLSRTDKMLPNGKSSREVTTAGRRRRSPFFVASLATFATVIAAVGIFFGVQRVRTHASVVADSANNTSTPPPPQATPDPLPSTLAMPTTATAATSGAPATPVASENPKAVAAQPTTAKTRAPSLRGSGGHASPSPSPSTTHATPIQPTTPTATPTETPRTPGVASSRYD